MIPCIRGKVTFDLIVHNTVTIPDLSCMTHERQCGGGMMLIVFRLLFRAEHQKPFRVREKSLIWRSQIRSRRGRIMLGDEPFLWNSQSVTGCYSCRFFFPEKKHSGSGEYGKECQQVKAL